MDLKVIHPKVTGKVRGPQSIERMGEWRLGTAEPSESRCKCGEQHRAGGGLPMQAYRYELRRSGLCNMQIANQ